ncbi:ribonuclease P protein subunit [Candidatus Bathyarchaeota archaeon]|nr:ribonuclease P protein subunit [Candidatus Bathyarchaeota archaeon]MBS7630753.1 ribonuclease P protein subunit [Candidatus Bathyarchaeota archaeon]
MISSENIILHELIGLESLVMTSSNPTCKVKGIVVDETKNTLIIEQDDVRKRIIKQDSFFRFKLPNGTMIEIDGSAIIGRPEDRVKKKIKRRW